MPNSTSSAKTSYCAQNKTGFSGGPTKFLVMTKERIAKKSLERGSCRDSTYACTNSK